MLRYSSLFLLLLLLLDHVDWLGENHPCLFSVITPTSPPPSLPPPVLMTMSLLLLLIQIDSFPSSPFLLWVVVLVLLLLLLLLTMTMSHVDRLRENRPWPFSFTPPLYPPITPPPSPPLLLMTMLLLLWLLLVLLLIQVDPLSPPLLL